MRGIATLVAVVAGLGTATAATAVPAPTPDDFHAVQVAQARAHLRGFDCDTRAVQGPRALVRDDRVHMVNRASVRLRMQSGATLLYWCQREATQSWEPGEIDAPLGSAENPLHVFNSPSTNEGGGSRAWADYGLYQVLRATRPSPAAKAICQLENEGDSIWVDGGMVTPGQWELVAATVLTRQPGDVDVFVDDPDGSHGGNCSLVGLVLRHV